MLFTKISEVLYLIQKLLVLYSDTYPDMIIVG